MKKLHFRTVRLLTSAALFLGATMTNTVSAAAPNVATDPSLDPRVREFLVHINKDPTPFWELPQPKPQEILTSLQKQTPVVSGVTTTERTIAQDGTSVKIYIMEPEHLSGKA
jgi:hypothetical protein